MVINGYELEKELKTDNSGFSKWGFARKNGKEYFIKEFISPVYPIFEDVLEPEMIQRKKEICSRYVSKSSTLYRMINECSDGNLVRIEHFFRCGSKYYITMEKISGIMPEEISMLSMEERIRLCKILTHSIAGLHQYKIVHADLKLDNIIFCRMPYGSVTAKVIDFDGCFWETAPPDSTEEVHGDLVYMAPETFQMMAEEEGVLTSAIDVFALALIFHQILTGALPEFDHEMYDYPFESVLDGNQLMMDPLLDSDLRAMLLMMTERNPKRRLTSGQVWEFWCRYTGVGTVMEEPDFYGDFTKEKIYSEKPAEKINGSYFSAAGDL